MLSWFNCMGLDGGTVTYAIKDVFLSDDAASTIAAVEVVEEVVAEAAPEAEVPKTGESTVFAMISMICLAGCALGFIVTKKRAAQN
jgi:LPXTG-motif cell wall-anchored protein